MTIMHTQGPWAVTGRAGYTGHGISMGAKRICAINSNSALPKDERDANARLLAAAPDLLAAAQKLESAETFNANCEECDGEGAPELCEHCFPLFDDARVMRRNAIAKGDVRGQEINRGRR